jgi:HAE1 family hydrophobic/amphiphilic exporter-1
LIEAALRRPTATFVATIALAALGAFSFLQLPLSLLPSIERPRLVVTARAASVSRDDLLHQTTVPLERRLGLVPGITSIESETTDGVARITIESSWQSDPDRLRVDVARRIEGASAIPLDELSVDVEGSDVQPVIEVAVTGGSGASRTALANRVVLPELARIDGAGKIDVIGASPLRVVVEPRASDLVARGLTAADVESRLAEAGRSIAAGRVREGSSVRPLVIVQPARTLEDVRAIQIRGGQALSPVPLSEIANVSLPEVPDNTSFRTPAGEGVLLRVHRAPGANAVALARAVRARVDGVHALVVTDRSREVSRALAELGAAALAGLLLGTLLLRWILGRWRSTLALSVVIPVALLTSFAVFLIARVSLDVMSLAGLALATGLLVDNSIVVLESIETAGDVLRGTKRIALAVIASSITLMIVFAPLLYLRGLARALFGEQAIAVVASVGASLLLSLTLTPVLAARGGAETHPRNPGLASYRRALDRALASPRLVLIGAVVAVIAAIAIAFFLPRELFARGSSPLIVANFNLDPDLDPRAAREIGATIWSRAKSVALSMQQRADGEGEIVARGGEDVLRDALRVPGVTSRVRVQPSAFIEGIGGDAQRTEVIVSGSDDLTTRVTRALTQSGFRSVDDPNDRPRSTMTLRWNEQLLAASGITRAAAENDVRAATSETDAGQSAIPGSEPSIRLLPVTPRALESVPVRAGDRVVPLTALATANIAAQAPFVRHDQGRPAQRLLFENPRGADASRVLATIPLTASERIRLAGHARELRDAFADMRLAAILAVLLLYLTIAAFYESLILPLLVMATLPFAAAGAFVALFITGQSLNVMSLIGLVFLAGIVVNHTIVLIDRAEQLRRSGASEDDAIRGAAEERYRPVMLTTATAVLGMLPLALIGGDGVELRRAIAIAVIGGLVTATAGTLLLIPLLHRLVEPLRRPETGRA